MKGSLEAPAPMPRVVERFVTEETEGQDATVLHDEMGLKWLKWQGEGLPAVSSLRRKVSTQQFPLQTER